MSNLTEAWHQGYEAYYDMLSNPYEEDTQEYDDFQWGYSCANSDEESYQEWRSSEDEE